MTIDDLACKIKTRENCMLKFHKFKKTLEYNLPQALEFLKLALINYEKPETYSLIDIEVVNFIAYISDHLSLDEKTNLISPIKEILNELKNTNSNTPLWLIDFVDLKLASLPDPNDPRYITQIKNLISKYNDVVELRLALATAMTSYSCDTENEKEFQKSLKLFTELECFFEKKMKLSDRYRIHFPPDPIKLFFQLKTWATLNYVSYLQYNHRNQEAINLLISALKHPWIHRIGEKDRERLERKLELAQLSCSTVAVSSEPQYIIETQINNTITNSPNSDIQQGNTASSKTSTYKIIDVKQIIELVKLLKQINLKDLSPNKKEELQDYIEFFQDIKTEKDIKDSKFKIMWQRCETFFSKISALALTIKPILDLFSKYT